MLFEFDSGAKLYYLLLSKSSQCSVGDVGVVYWEGRFLVKLRSFTPSSIWDFGRTILE